MSIKKEKEVLLEKNPYGEPIETLWSDIEDKWEFPYLHNLLRLILILIILVIIGCLYFSIGIFSQISGTIWRLIKEAYKKFDTNKPVETSAYVVAAGVYFLIFLPFYLIQFPFWLIGLLFSNSDIRSIIIVFTLIAMFVLFFSIIIPKCSDNDYEASIQNDHHIEDPINNSNKKAEPR